MRFRPRRNDSDALPGPEGFPAPMWRTRRAIVFERAGVGIWTKDCLRGGEKVEKDITDGSICGRGCGKRAFGG
jgi:hypothetical protein